jgi:hypothetical protein
MPEMLVLLNKKAITRQAALLYATGLTTSPLHTGGSGSLYRCGAASKRAAR